MKILKIPKDFKSSNYFIVMALNKILNFKLYFYSF